MKKLMSLTTATLLFGQVVMAAAGAHGDSHIPWFELIVPQIVNFTAVVVGLVVLLKKPVKAYFTSQHQEFENARSAAERAKSQAEIRHQEIKKQIADLDATAAQSIRQAETEAAELRERIIKEAKDSAEKMTTEAERMVAFEITRATSALRAELIGEALTVAEKDLKSNIEKPSQQRLNDEFIEKIRAVRP